MVHHYSIYPNKYPEVRKEYPYVAIMPKEVTKTNVDYVWYIPAKYSELAVKILGAGCVTPTTVDDVLVKFRRALEWWMVKAVNKAFAIKEDVESTNARSIRRYRGNQYIEYLADCVATN